MGDPELTPAHAWNHCYTLLDVPVSVHVDLQKRLEHTGDSVLKSLATSPIANDHGHLEKQ